MRNRFIDGFLAALLILGMLFTINQCAEGFDHENYRHDQSARSILGKPHQTFDQWKAEQIREAAK